MRIFRKALESDYIKFKKIYETGKYLFDFKKEESFIMQEDNQESVIFYCPPVFMRYWIDEKGVLNTSSFYINEENKIVAFTLGDYQVNLNDDKGIVLVHEDGNIYYLNLLSEGVEYDTGISNNGTLVFSQYNEKKKTRVVSKYEHNVWCGNRQIYRGRLGEPFSVTIETKVNWRDRGLKFIGHNRTYYKLDFDVNENRWQYDIATAKDFGTGAILAGDSYSLQNRESFIKYYRVLFSFGDYITITGFPFTRQYDKDDIDKLVQEFGFSLEVPEFFMRVYNGQEELRKGNEDILSWYLNNIELGRKFVK